MGMFGGGVAGGNYGGAAPSLPITLVYKAEDEDRFAGGYTDDLDLVFELEANSIYKIDCLFQFNTAGAGWRLRLLSSEAVVNFARSTSTSLAAQPTLLDRSTVSGSAGTSNATSSNGEMTYDLVGYVVTGDNPVTVALQWNTANPTNSIGRTRLRKGSYMTFTRLNPAE